MAQLVARFHGMEEVGGSNPPSSTEKTDTQLVSVGFLLLREPVVTFFSGYRTKRVGFVVTFRLVGAEKSVLKLVGANLKDGQNVLVL